MKTCFSSFPKNWMRLGLLTALTASFSLDLQAQSVPSIQWDKTLGGSGYEELFSLHQTTDGGYILGGRSDSGVSGDKSQASKGSVDYWVVKLDQNGTKVWDKTFGGNSDDVLMSLQQTSDGGYILGGWSDSGISGDKSQISRGDTDYWVIKLDASGNKIWDKTFGGSNFDALHSLQQTLDGGYILGGQSHSSLSGDKSENNKGTVSSPDYWVIKLDANGNKMWDKTYGGIGVEILFTLQQTSDGGYMLGGYSDSGISEDKSQPNQGSYDYWVIRLDASGNKLWDKTYGGSEPDILLSLQTTVDGGFILCGSSPSGISSDKSQASKGGSDYWLVKLDASGNKMWDGTFGGSSNDGYCFVKQTLEGGYIIGGSSHSGISGDKTQPSQGLSDIWIIKLDASGYKIWDRTIGGNSSDGLSALQQTSDGGYIFGGHSYSGISGDKTQVSQGNFDFWVIKLAADITGVKETEATFSLSISPNPNQGRFKLHLTDLTSPKAEVTITDLLGRKILEKQLQVTDNRLSEELNLPAAKGMYLLKVIAGSETLTRKIVAE